MLKNLKLTDEEKLKLGLKYQILTEFTFLIAEIELSDKISENMKLKILGNKEKNYVIIKKKESEIFSCYGKTYAPPPREQKESFGFIDSIRNTF